MMRLLVILVSALLVAGCQAAASPSPEPIQSSAAPASAGPVATPDATDGPIATSEGSPIAAGSRWEIAGTPLTSKLNSYDFRAIPIAGNRVLVLSHDTEEPYGPTAQIWDAATNAWHETEPLPKSRQLSVAVPLADGRALVTGGVNDQEQSYSSTYIFDPATETWSKSGLLGTARTNATAAVLKDGRVLVAGGHFRNGPTGATEAPTVILAAFNPGLADIDMPVFTAALATAEIFDPATGTWSSTGPMIYARNGAQAVTLNDGKVLIFGSEASWNSGVAVDERTFESAEIYDPATGTFTLAGSLPPIEREALQASGPTGANPIPLHRPDPGFGELVVVPDSRPFLIGLGQGWKHVGEITRSFWLEDDWVEMAGTYVAIGEPTPHMLYVPGVRDLSGSTASLLPDGRILIAGGYSSLEPFDDEGRTSYRHEHSDEALIFDPGGEWSIAPAMPVPRAGGTAVTLADGSVLVLGGNFEIGEGMEGPPAVRFIP